MLRTRLTLKPGRPGTKRLTAQYGDRLLCVRYRYDENEKVRYKTVELIVDEVPWPPMPSLKPLHDTDLVTITITPEEKPLREMILRLGGSWTPAQNTCCVSYAVAKTLNLIRRIIAAVHTPADGNDSRV